MSDYPEHKELLEGFRQGNEQAVRRLFHLFYASLHYYAHSMIDHTQEAQDIAVESFLKLLERKT